ncbi:hypothetical protein BH20CHL8_BH20CHL8_07460 [soil metagenome]
MAENVSDTVRTYTAKATFTSGGTIVATAVGAVSDQAPGQRRAFSLLADKNPIHSESWCAWADGPAGERPEGMGQFPEQALYTLAEKVQSFGPTRTVDAL